MTIMSFRDKHCVYFMKTLKTHSRVFHFHAIYQFFHPDKSNYNNNSNNRSLKYFKQANVPRIELINKTTFVSPRTLVPPSVVGVGYLS